MKLLVQEYLENKSFGDLVREHGVYASFSKSGTKFSLNYDQIEAKEADPLAQECRGLILSLMDGQHICGITNANGKVDRAHVIPGPTKILAFPMKRFFNHCQGSAAEINWHDPNLAILEKLDGSLCIVYWDPWKKEWCVATRSVPEADLPMDNGLFTFRTLFEKAVEDTLGFHFEQLCAELYEEFTYCFELTTPYNRIVVAYPNNRITLLAARSLRTMQEVDPNTVIFQSNVPVVRAYTYTSMNELVTWVSSLNPMEHEGVVVRDSQFNRIKVKNAAYVAASKIRDTLAASPRNCLELILLGKDDDAASFLPEEIVKNLQKLKTDLQVAIRKYDEAYQKAKLEADTILPGNKKTFAILITKNKELWHPPFFSMFEGKSLNMKDFILKSRKDGSWGNNFLDKMLELSKNSGA